MTKRRAALCAAVVWLMTLSGGHASAASDTEISPTGEQSFAQVAACVTNADTLLVSTVVDQSGSLQNTDPSDQRVGAVDTAVDALSGLMETAGGELDVQMNLSVFDGGYEEIVGWGSLSGDHPERLRETAAEQLPSRNTGDFTDYRAALGGAEDALRERSLSEDPDACKVVLWFTDGRFDVGNDTDAAVEEMCAPQGVVDSLRGDGIAVVALALFTSSGDGAVTSTDADLLRAVAEGEGDSSQCGTVPVPENYTSGAYLHAADASALRRVFAGAGTMIEGGQQALTATCPGEGCVDGQFRVPLDPGVSGFRLVLDGVREDAPPTLRSPDGTAAELIPGEQTLGDGELSATSRDGLTVVDLAFPSGGSPGGSWVMDTQATPERISVVDLYYFWGVGLEVRAPEGLTIGQTSTLEAVLTYADGTPVQPEPFQSLSVRMSVGGEDLALTPGEPGIFRGEYEVPGQGAPSALDVSVVAEAVSSPSSVRLGPVTVSARPGTVLPPAFATLITSELSLPQIVADGTARGPLAFRGSESGETQVCVADVTVSGPTGAGAIDVATEGECLAIDAGASVEWPVEVIPSQPADGRVDGVITLRMTAVDGVDTITVDVPFDASMMRPVNEPLRWALEVLLVLLGLLIPVAIAWATNYFNGTYRVSSRTVQAQVPVTVTARGLVPRARKRLLTVDDFDGLKVSGDRRWSKVDGGVLRLRRRLPWWPFSEVKYEAVSSSPSRMLLSSREPYSRARNRAPAESNFRGVFFLDVAVPSAPAEEYDAQLAFFDEDDPDLSTVIRRREEQIADFRDWPVIVALITDEVEGHSGQDIRGQPAAETNSRATTRPPAPTEDPDHAAAGEDRPSLWSAPASADGGPSGRRGLWTGDELPRGGRDKRAQEDARAAEDDRSDKPRSIFDD